MTFLAPWFLVGAIAVAAGIAALHFIVTRQPRASVLPTARFVPDSAATAIVRDARPSDLLLMVLRIVVVLAAGAALARPVIKPKKEAIARVFLVDASRSVAEPRDVVESVEANFQAGDAIVTYDSSARSVAAPDSIRPTTAQGNLSAGLIAALRTASSVRDRADSLELVIVSSFDDSQRDAATDSIRKLWPGRARPISVALAHDSTPVIGGGVEFAGAGDDPLGVAYRFASRSTGQATVRVIRTNEIDSTWLAGEHRLLVVWPTSERPPFSVAAPATDLIGGVTAGDAQVVAAFTRRWRFTSDSTRDARVIARWADGEPAVVEKRSGTGCLRSVAIPVNPVGDLVLRSEFLALFKEITAACSTNRTTQQGSSASLAGPRSLAAASMFAARDDLSSPLTPWLLGIALAAAVAELFLRRRT